MPSEAERLLKMSVYSQEPISEEHILPDGQTISIRSKDAQQLAAAVLVPSLLGKDLPDLPAATITQIMQHPDGPTRKVHTFNIKR